MNVLLIGSGGREHALAKKITESPSLTKLYCSPGSAGTKNLAENIPLNLNDYSTIPEFCDSKNIELIVVGPEKPLADGLSDFLRKNNFKVFGPDSAAASIESQKTFAKNLMQKYKIPTAGFKEYSFKDSENLKQELAGMKYPLVIKADGLAAGKGVLICESFNQAKEAVKEIFDNKIFGDAGNKIIVEEFMYGEEASIFAIADGKDFICLPAAQDHKRIGDNDTGKNTGGMGAYAPAPLITESILKEIETKIIRPTINALSDEGKPFIGCLYAGLMITESGPKVVEFNCRFGDPETQSVLPLLDGDFLQLLYSAASGKIDKTSIKYNGGSSVCVVIASGGYPDEYNSGFEINGLDAHTKNISIYHAGTKESDGKIVTAGGRVLGVTSFITENNLQVAKEIAYEAVNKIHFKNMYYRTDIADKALKKK